MSRQEKLRAVIADEAVSPDARKQAAKLLVAELVDAVPEPGDDHAEVIELRTPWKDDGPLGSFAPWAWARINLADGFSEAGPTVAQAKRRIHDRLRLRALLALVVDDGAHRLERLEACQRVLDHLHRQSFERNTAPTAEQMLAKVLPANGMKWGSWREGKVPVERPPQTFTDVWY